MDYIDVFYYEDLLHKSQMRLKTIEQLDFLKYQSEIIVLKMIIVLITNLLKDKKG